MRVQVLIIGAGLAGTSVYRELVARGIDCVIVDSPALSSASRISSGILNPMALRSLRPQEHLIKAANLLGCEPQALLREFYGAHYRDAEIAHVLNSAEETEAWERARKSEGSPSSFLGEARLGPFPEPFASWGFSTAGAWAPIFGCGLVNMDSFLALENGPTCRVFRDQQYASLPVSHHADRVECGEISADFAIFCEGWRILGNPLWASVRMKPAKGEIVEVRLAEPGNSDTAATDKITILSASCHVVIRDSNLRLCDVGASASWDLRDEEPGDAARADLLDKLSKIYRGPVTVESQRAGIRPPASDRRPIVGTHPDFARFAIVNGLGGRGLLVAPVLAMLLVDRLFPESRRLAAEIPHEWDVARFF